MTRKLAGALGVLVLVWAAPGHGAPYRRPEVAITVVLSPRVAAPPAAAVPDDGAPSITIEDVVADPAFARDAVDPDRLQELRAVDVADLGTDEKHAHYLALAAELAKQARHTRDYAAVLATSAASAGDAARKAVLTKESARAATDGKRALIEAVKAYKTLADDAASSRAATIDVALFGYGYLLQGAGYMKEARAVFDQLLKNYPSSAYVPLAYLAFADYFFAANQLADAEARYNKVLQFPKSPAYWFAMYKVGWLHLRLQRHQDALEAFASIAMAAGTVPPPPQEVVRVAARTDLVRAYAEVGKPDQAAAFFKRIDRGGALDLQDRLAARYVEAGKPDRAIATYRELMKIAPTDARACGWQYRIAHARLWLPGAGIADRIADVEHLVRLHMTLDRAKTLPATAAGECRANAAAMPGELARVFHLEATKTLAADRADAAARLYQLYLDAFPGAPDRARMQSLRAELAWSRAEAERDAERKATLWDLAAAAFTEVDDAYAVVIARRNALGGHLEPAAVDLKPSRTVEKARPIPAREAALVEAFDGYRATIDPADAELASVGLAVAGVLRQYGHLDRAIPILVAMVKRQGDERSALLLLDTLLRAHRYDEMLAQVDAFAADTAFVADKPELERALRVLRSRSMRYVLDQ